MFYVLLPSEAHRRALIAHFKANNITSVFHYMPLHLSEMGRKFGGKPGDCPVCEDVSGCLIRLPFHTGLTESQQRRVMDVLMRFRV
jgi:dTDP-4-amino-4,6-dideoxygalactose transaminase